MNLKFRAYDKDGQKMFSEDELIIWNNNVYANDSEKLSRDYLKGWSIDGQYLMQSTGLTDKNGKEIFEGDIVRVDGFKNIVVKFGKIEHQENDGGVAIYQGFNLLIRGGYPEAVMSDFEIVGNVFENIHLL